MFLLLNILLNIAPINVDQLVIDLDGDSIQDSVFVFNNDTEIGDSTYASHIRIQLSSGTNYLYEGKNEWKELSGEICKYKESKFLGFKKINRICYLFLTDNGYGCCLPTLSIFQIYNSVVSLMYDGEFEIDKINELEDSTIDFIGKDRVDEGVDFYYNGKHMYGSQYVPFKVFNLSTSLLYNKSKSIEYNNTHFVGYYEGEYAKKIFVKYNDNGIPTLYDLNK